MIDGVNHWAALAARAAEDKLADDAVVIDVGDVLGITGAFVIATGRNARQVRAIAEEVEEQVAAAEGPRPLRVEGLREATWILMDYGDFVVHVFDAEARSFYDLDRLWSDCPRIPHQR